VVEAVNLEPAHPTRTDRWQQFCLNRPAVSCVRPLLAADIEMVIPGDNAAISVSLDKPVALDIGSRFAIREGGRTVGSGVITEVAE
jgi:elongation factor Tu